MPFSSLVAAMDATVIETFKTDDPARSPFVVIHFKDGSPDLQLDIVPKNPMMEETYVPGSDQNASVVLLFVHPPAGSKPVTNGDTATYGVSGQTDYDIFQVDTDREGGQTLRMRRRGQRFDQ